MSHRGFAVLAVVVAPLLGLTSPGLLAQSADLSLTKVDTPDPVTAGGTLIYDVAASNEGPDDATSAVMNDPLPAGTTFQSLAPPAGWLCATPAPGTNGTVSCTAASFPVGTAQFTITVAVAAGTANGTVLANTATVASATPDPNPGNESATAETTVTTVNLLVGVVKSGAPDPVASNADLTYTLTAANNGGGDLESAALSDTLPPGTSFVSLASPGGWSCTAPAVGAGGAVSCSAAPFSPGNAVFTLVVHVAATVSGGSSISNVADLAVTDSGRTTSFSGSAVTAVVSPANLTASKTVSGSFLVGSPVTYTVVITNTSASTQMDNPGPEFTDTLPPALTLLGASATSGVASANLVTNRVDWDGAIAGGGSVTLTIQATLGPVAGGTVIQNQGTVAYDADGNGTNESNAPSDDPGTVTRQDPTAFIAIAPLASVPALDTAGLAAASVLLLLAGLRILRRERHGLT